MHSLQVSPDEFPNLFIAPEFSILDAYSLYLPPTEESEYKAILASQDKEIPQNTRNKYFIYDVLNELRHKYSDLDEERSFRYSNRILSNFFMDEYIVGMLAGGQIGKNDSTAVRWLLTNASKFPQLFQVRSACLLQAAKIYEAHGCREEAVQLSKAFFIPSPGNIEGSNYFSYANDILKCYPNLLADLPREDITKSAASSTLTFEQKHLIQELLHKYGMQPPQELWRWALPAIRFLPTGALPMIGGSRLGGLPDVPPDWEWPGQLEFLAQFNLAELAPYDTESLLPKQGLLQIFAQWEGEDNYHIYIYDGDFSLLKPATSPENFTVMGEGDRADGYLRVYRSVSVTPVSVISLPTTYALYDEDEENGELLQALGILHSSLNSNIHWSHQMFGNHGFIDGNAAVNAWEHTTGKNYYHLSPEEKERLRPELEDWILLFQMDSCDEIGTSFSDAGIYYFMIRKEDLAARRFDKIYFSMWCS